MSIWRFRQLFKEDMFRLFKPGTECTDFPPDQLYPVLEEKESTKNLFAAGDHERVSVSIFVRSQSYPKAD